MESFTKTPNFVFDLMPQLSPAEFKVLMVIVRKTYGYREEWAQISFSLFAEMTGLTRQGVFNCVESLMTAGHIERRQVGAQSFEYQVKPFNSVEQTDEQNHSTELNEPFNSVEWFDDQKTPTVQLSRTKPFNSVDPLKKERNKANTSSDDNAAQSVAAPSEQQQMFAEVCSIVGWDAKTLDERSRGQIAQTLGFLKKAEPPYTLAELRDFGPKVWAHDWRWEKQKQRPSLAQLRQEIGKLRAKDFCPNGTGPPNGTSTWEQAFANQEEPDYIKQMKAGGKQ